MFFAKLVYWISSPRLNARILHLTLTIKLSTTLAPSFFHTFINFFFKSLSFMTTSLVCLELYYRKIKIIYKKVLHLFSNTVLRRTYLAVDCQRVKTVPSSKGIIRIMRPNESNPLDWSPGKLNCHPFFHPTANDVNHRHHMKWNVNPFPLWFNPSHKQYTNHTF